MDSNAGKVLREAHALKRERAFLSMCTCCKWAQVQGKLETWLVAPYPLWRSSPQRPQASLQHSPWASGGAGSLAALWGLQISVSLEFAQQQESTYSWRACLIIKWPEKYFFSFLGTDTFFKPSNKKNSFFSSHLILSTISFMYLFDIFVFFWGGGGVLLLGPGWQWQHNLELCDLEERPKRQFVLGVVQKTWASFEPRLQVQKDIPLGK